MICESINGTNAIGGGTEEGAILGDGAVEGVSEDGRTEAGAGLDDGDGEGSRKDGRTEERTDLGGGTAAKTGIILRRTAISVFSSSTVTSTCPSRYD
jgi:hypothetical protein